MTINFNKIEIHHFMSFEDEIFEFKSQNGMNLVTGRNFDIPEGKNGAGKCLDPTTQITVQTNDQDFINWINSKK